MFSMFGRGNERQPSPSSISSEELIRKIRHEGGHEFHNFVDSLYRGMVTTKQYPFTKGFHLKPALKELLEHVGSKRFGSALVSACYQLEPEAGSHGAEFFLVSDPIPPHAIQVQLGCRRVRPIR